MAEGRSERFPALAIELVQLKVDIIVAAGTQPTRAAMQATGTIPIVMSISAYPDKIGLVESLARPGGNVTGLSNVSPDLMAKRFELLKEIAPKVSRVAVLWNPASPVEPLGFQAVQAAGAATGLEIKSIEVRTPDDYVAGFAAATGSHADALYALSNPANFKFRQLIVDFASKSRLPDIYEDRSYIESGGSCPTGQVSPTCIDAPRPMSTRSSRERSRPNFPSSSPRSSSCSSTRRLPRHSASRSRNRCCCAGPR